MFTSVNQSGNHFSLASFVSKLVLACCCLWFAACAHQPQENPAQPVVETTPQDEATPTPEDPIEQVQPTLVCPEPEPVLPVPECPKPKPVRCPVCPAAKLDGKLVIGQTERVKVSPGDITYTARIDSGAAGTSIHAVDIVRFERDGERWVRFTIDNPKGEPITLEREIERRVRIRQVELENFERRLVVLMTLTLGSITQQTEVSLTDRSGMEFPLLVGRNFLHNNAVVDVSQEFIAK